MVKIFIDGKSYEVKPDRNLLETCLALGIDIPHFCYHPALGSVGACRLCAVKKFRDKDDAKGRIVMSCMEPVTEGLIVSVDDKEAAEFRAAVIESLMTNHPHDCPVCDEGGECHLQDMTIMSGHTYRRFDFPKRTYRNQELGPFINHEMNRCIQCYRCVRFYRDYAGGKDLNVFASRNHVYFGRHKDGPLESVFSGNLVEVCPTGVFTDKTLKSHFTRKWDLTNSPSVCVHCSIGCNTIVSERYGSARRIMSRYNGAVNGYFLCDRGRFGYEFVNSEKRIKEIVVRNSTVDYSGELEKALSSGKKLIGIGSPRATLESNYALLSLTGSDNFYQGVAAKEYSMTKVALDYMTNSGVYLPSLKEVEQADAIFIIGEDLINTAPMLSLAVRQAAKNMLYKDVSKHNIPQWNDIPVRELSQNGKGDLYIATAFTDDLEDVARDVFHGSFKDIAELGHAVMQKVQKKKVSEKSDYEPLAEKIAKALVNAKSPLIISGISSGDKNILATALNVASSLREAGKEAMLSIVFPECNSLGLSMLPGKPFEELLDKKTEIDTLIVLENDLFRRADKQSVNELFGKCEKVIVLDQLSNQTTEQADVLLPVAAFSESEGTLVNNEGRAQRFYKAVVVKNDQMKESWRWLDELSVLRDKSLTTKWTLLDDVSNSMSYEFPAFSKLKDYEPDADFRMLNTKIPRQTMRFSGRTAMNANVDVSEQKLPVDADSPLSFSMEGQAENPPSSLVPFYWKAGWNSVQALYGYVNEPGASLKGGDPGIKLIEQKNSATGKFISVESKTSGINKDRTLIIPYYQTFGSEELSSESASVKQKILEPFVMMNARELEKLSISEGDHVKLEINNKKISLIVHAEDNLPLGVAALSAGLAGMPYISFPGTGKIVKD